MCYSGSAWRNALCYSQAMRGWKMEGSELKRRREALGLSINALAHEFRCAPSSIMRWERDPQESGAQELQGLMAFGADAVLKRLEAQKRKGG